MNAHNPLPAAYPLGSKASVSLPPLGEALATYQLRFDECTACDTAVTFSCTDCEGTGEVLAGCADCSKCLPLHGDGLCVRCEDSRELPLAAFNAKYLGQGWARVEL